jgi:hypothetical protein
MNIRLILPAFFTWNKFNSSFLPWSGLISRFQDDSSIQFKSVVYHPQEPRFPMGVDFPSSSDEFCHRLYSYGEYSSNSELSTFPREIDGEVLIFPFLPGFLEDSLRSLEELFPYNRDKFFVFLWFGFSPDIQRVKKFIEVIFPRKEEFLHITPWTSNSFGENQVNLDFLPPSGFSLKIEDKVFEYSCGFYSLDSVPFVKSLSSFFEKEELSLSILWNQGNKRNPISSSPFSSKKVDSNSQVFSWLSRAYYHLDVYTDQEIEAGYLTPAFVQCQRSETFNLFSLDYREKLSFLPSSWFYHVDILRKLSDLSADDVKYLCSLQRSFELVKPTFYSDLLRIFRSRSLGFLSFRNDSF